jgi:hypothetical protein
MMNRPFALFCAALSAGLVARSAAAQSDAAKDIVKIEIATATYLRDSLPTSGVVFETRVKRGPGTGGWVEARSAERVRAIATALRATPGHTDSIHVCNGASPSSCSLRNTSAIVAIFDPIISGSTAHVTVRRLDSTHLKRVPVRRLDLVVELVREAGKWRVVGSRMISVT